MNRWDVLNCKNIFSINGPHFRWEFRTEEHDIGFGLTRTVADNKKEETVVKSKRFNCSIIAEEGSVICDRIATCKSICNQNRS